jgi:hypothetical protein
MEQQLFFIHVTKILSLKNTIHMIKFSSEMEILSLETRTIEKEGKAPRGLKRTDERKILDM